GVLELGFPRARRFEPAEREAASAMALQIAQALARSRRYEAERESRAGAERSRFRLEFLAAASDRLATSLDYRQTLATVAELAVTALADWCAIHLLDDDGRVQLVNVVAGDPETERTLTALLERFPATLDDPHGAGAALRTGMSQLFADIPDEVLAAVAGSPEHLAALRGLGLRSGIAVPLKARGRTLGAITVARSSGAPYRGGDLILAEELARRAALAVDTALRYARERDVAVTLQHSLLPEVLAHPEGMALASRYLPSAIDTEVGGDWYDVIALPDGTVGLVVGDVMGHGVHAAAIMGQLRTAVRAYALENHPPAALISRLDGLVQTLGGLQLTTCVYAVYDPQRRTLTLTSAGHPPPLVVNADGAAELLGVEPGLPLGVGGCDYTTATVTLPPGTSLLLYTDVLVEGRTRTLGDGLRRLRDAVSAPGLTPHQLCDRVLTALGHGYDNDDDIALLALTTDPGAGAPSEQVVACITLDPVPESARLARDFVTAMLRIWQLRDAEGTTALLVSELVTNAVRHAGTAVELTVTVQAPRLRLEVVDGSQRCPTVRDVEPDQAEGGRGMVLVDALAADWGCDPLPASKRIWADVVLDAAPVA
ncbi:MAG: SpoIIE family protein phosphatase, partial [Actinomycetota bacterium]|nr:SpoIIE family protein phosphatase [Actinomycetota bacterium]